AKLAASPPRSKSPKEINRTTDLQSSCPACQLVARVLPARFRGQSWKLIAMSSSRALLDCESKGEMKNSDCTILFPVLAAKLDDKTEKRDCAEDWYEAGFLALVVDDQEQLLETGPRKICAEVDTQLVKTWLTHCRDRHEICSALGSGSPYVRGLRVIDCYLEKTVDAPAHRKYLALSYVWGDSAERNNDSSFEYPPVVLDAIQITKSLGEQYLW
ncbi:hypothetical protein F5Y18DRAFT_9765, partial [Xylariaceae sp. FL1019]